MFAPVMLYILFIVPYTVNSYITIIFMTRGYHLDSWAEVMSKIEHEHCGRLPGCESKPISEKEKRQRDM